MIDELELLLREEQEEPEEVPASLKGKSAGYFAPSAGQTARIAREEETEDAPDADLPDGLLRREKTASAEGMTDAEQRENGARSLYRALTRAARARQEPFERGRTALIREGRQSTGTSQDILRLDRAFQRDARRYDGGFIWQ